MPRVLVFLSLFFFAHPSFSGAHEEKQAKKQANTYVKVQIRGVLKVTGEFRKKPELGKLFAGKPGLYNGYGELANHQSDVSTGVTVATEQMGTIEVYLGEDKKLYTLAEKLNGKTVVLSGDLRLLEFWPPNCSPWNPKSREHPQFISERTTWGGGMIMKTIVRGTSIQVID
jgi:hypothetical protein